MDKKLVNSLLGMDKKLVNSLLGMDKKLVKSILLPVFLASHLRTWRMVQFSKAN